jgi:hypothetical protein
VTRAGRRGMRYHPGRMDYVAVVGVLVAIVAGAIGLPVALKQLRLSRDLRDLERAKVYDAIKKYLNAVSQLGYAPTEVLREFHDATEDKRVRVLFAKSFARPSSPARSRTCRILSEALGELGGAFHERLLWNGAWRKRSASSMHALKPFSRVTSRPLYTG